MRLSRFLHVVRETIPSADGLTESIEKIGGIPVLVDPGLDQLRQIASVRHSRGLIVDQHLYLWDANRALHIEVYAAIKYDNRKHKLSTDEQIEVVRNRFDLGPTSVPELEWGFEFAPGVAIAGLPDLLNNPTIRMLVKPARKPRSKKPVTLDESILSERRDHDYIEDPSPNQIIGMINRSSMRDGEVRGLIVAGHLYVWPSSIDLIHEEFFKQLGMSPGLWKTAIRVYFDINDGDLDHTYGGWLRAGEFKVVAWSNAAPNEIDPKRIPELRGFIQRASKRVMSEAMKPGPTPADLAWIRQQREKCRRDEGGGGYCHIVSEIIQNRFGWEQAGGTVCTDQGEPVCVSHRWNVLPNGDILDSTADQLGQPDIIILKKGSKEWKRYRLEYDQDYNPDLAKDYPELHGVPWSGKHDAEWSDELRGERGEDWHLNPAQRKARQAYLKQQRRYAVQRDPGIRKTFPGIKFDEAMTLSEAREVISGATVWVNPSGNQILGLARRRPLRGLYLGQTLYVWDAAEQTHIYIYMELVYGPDSMHVDEIPLSDYRKFNQSTFIIGRINAEAGREFEGWGIEDGPEIAPGIHMVMNPGAEKSPTLVALIQRTRKTKLPEAVDPTDLYFHGTSSQSWPAIRQRGLVARTSQRVYDKGHGLASYPGVYLAGDFNDAYNAAERAVVKFGGSPIVIGVLVDRAKATIDEDRVWDWFENYLLKTRPT